MNFKEVRHCYEELLDLKCHVKRVSYVFSRHNKNNAKECRWDYNIVGDFYNDAQKLQSTIEKLLDKVEQIEVIKEKGEEE